MLKFIELHSCCCVGADGGEATICCGGGGGEDAICGSGGGRKAAICGGQSTMELDLLQWPIIVPTEEPVDDERGSDVKDAMSSLKKHNLFRCVFCFNTI
jgi:hypothetical protein